MGLSEDTRLREELARRVRERTGRRVVGLVIELSAERVVLRGRARTYHVKQLAQHGVREVLPDAPLENAIVVE